jgi:nucleoside-specific outer membrane channel protein Tsx
VYGYKYGTNFFNLDLLMSDNKDPDATGGGAQEAYFVYRNTVELSKVTGGNYSWGIVRDWAGVFGFDWNTKNDAGYQSKKRMGVLGPAVEFDVCSNFGKATSPSASLRATNTKPTPSWISRGTSVSAPCR